MKEIERILTKYITGQGYIEFTELANAIKQYIDQRTQDMEKIRKKCVLEARIEELEILKKEGDKHTFEDLRDTIPKRIAELKKGVE